MKTHLDVKPLTVRLPAELYEVATAIAHKKCVSLNTLIQESLKAMVKEEEDREMYEAYTLLGQDQEECSVEYAIYAQAEVMLSDKY